MRLGFSCGCVLACSTVIGCFTGADAEGLPCNEDKDCGIDLACREGYCGGPPAGSETSTTASTSSSTESSSSEETGIPGCAVQPGDPGFCMPADPGTDDENCNFDCTVQLCGDGHVNEAAGEMCELPVPGMSTCECDAIDCSVVMCGDGQVNELVGEDCDQTDAEEYDECTPQCRSNTFGDVLDDDAPWMVQVEGEGFTDGWTHETGEWWSGDYDILNQMTDPDRAVAGVTRLLSPTIVIPEAGGDPLVLRFRHRYDFDPYCDGGELAQADGGRVELWIDGAPIAWPESDAVYPDTLVDACTAIAAPVNPLGEVPAFAGVANDLADVEIPLPAAAYGETVQIVFLAGFDCGLCDVDSEPDGWRIDAVRIGPAVAGTCSEG